MSLIRPNLSKWISERGAVYGWSKYKRISDDLRWSKMISERGAVYGWSKYNSVLINLCFCAHSKKVTSLCTEPVDVMTFRRSIHVFVVLLFPLFRWSTVTDHRLVSSNDQALHYDVELSIISQNNVKNFLCNLDKKNHWCNWHNVDDTKQRQH